MSSSFDESSSLCVNPPSPPNGEKEESFDKKSSDEGQLSPTSSPLHHAGLSASSYSSQSHSKAKKSKGLTGLLSRAKEGAKKTKAALKHPYPKSPLKSPSKSVSKSLAKALSKSPGKSSRSKSPSLSPSTDNLTDDVSAQRCKIDENSEEWKAFQEMQERIKQTVQKTKSNLTKLASTSVADSEDGTVKPVAKPSAGSWVSFEQGEGEKDDKLTEIDIDVITNDKLDLSWAAYDESVVDADLIETEADLLHLEVTPVPSPRISPRVPSNSLRTSREDLNQTDLLSGDIPPTVNMDDLLGLGDTSVSQTSDSVNTTAVPLNQDLLGLGFDTQGEDTSNTDPFSALSTTQKPKAVELLFSSVGDSAQSSQRSSPCVFDSDLLGSLGASDSPCPQSQQEESSASQLANSLVDDFLGLGEAEQPAQPSHDIHSVFDPFKTISDDSHVIDNQATETSALAPANPFNTSNMSDQPLESSSAINPFDISTSDFLGTTETANVSTEESRTQSLNPWFSQTIEEVGDSSTDILVNREPSQKELFPDIAQPAASDHSDSLIQSAPAHPHPTDTALITTSKPVVQAASDFESLTSNICEETSGPQNTKETAEFTGTIVKAVQDFDDDFFGKVAPASDTVDVFDAWGLNATDTDASKNPFLDTFSTGEMNTEGFGDDANKNPFLSDDFSSFPTDTITPSNPFLGETDNTTTGTADLSAFLFESKEVCTDNSDSFDPFGVKNEEQSAPPERAAVSIFEAVSAAGDNQLVEPGEGDEEDDFAGVPMKLEIKPSSGKPLGKAPPLPPPPKTSAMPVRENPFDRDSPPEEEFAKFDVGEEAKRAERLETSMSMSTESSTPDDEEPPGPLEKYHPKFEGSGWHLMLRQPTKKKITGNRYWKNVFVKLAMAKEGPVLKLYTDEGERDSFQELPLQPCYSLSDISLQQYDQYGKIHTVKLQYIFYRERVGLRAERITPNFVRKPKPTMILDHSPQVSELLKFGSLKKDYLRTFIWEVEDALMNIEAHRDKTLSYTKDEVSVDVWDEFEAEIDKHGHITDKKSRVRIFCLAFVTGMPSCELGVNDKRRKGKEVVGRHDIIPVKTEDWIKIQDYEFHSVVEKEAFEKTNTIRFRPLDGCQFELMRFRARPKENRELPLQAKIQQTINGSHVEIRCELLVTGYHANSKKHGQFPCEDIEVHFPIPEQWIYLFRYERRFGYGSIRSAMRKPGKIKGLERLTMMAQGNLPPALLEASVGLAKYENVYRAVVWRINRLPERNEGAYKTHLFKLSMDLGPHDEMPAELEQYSDIEFTMPSSTVSKTQVRSVSVANPNPPEKWVRYVAKYQMKVEIEHCRAEEPQAAQIPDDSEDVQNDGY